MNGFYGGRMTSDRLLAVKNATCEAIDHLHKSMESCPDLEAEAPDPKGIKVAHCFSYWFLINHSLIKYNNFSLPKLQGLAHPVVITCISLLHKTLIEGVLSLTWCSNCKLVCSSAGLCYQCYCCISGGTFLFNNVILPVAYPFPLGLGLTPFGVNCNTNWETGRFHLSLQHPVGP